MARVLAAVAKEPSIVRWLHATDPDRNVTPELLRASLRYNTMIDSNEVVPPGIPRETASLFIPMYRRGCFVLGQLYGPMSPNALALAMLSEPHNAPRPRARRFVVDLSSPTGVEFVEYEWLSDGKLVVSLHDVCDNGNYQGQSIVFVGPPGPSSPVPSRVAMRISYSEVPLSKERQVPATEWSLGNASWENWIKAFSKMRVGDTAVTARYTVSGMGRGGANVEGVMATVLKEDVTIGESNVPSTSMNKLCRMFLHNQDMLFAHPELDGRVVRDSERRQFANTVEALYEDDYDSLREDESHRNGVSHSGVRSSVHTGAQDLQHRQSSHEVRQTRAVSATRAQISSDQYTTNNEPYPHSVSPQSAMNTAEEFYRAPSPAPTGTGTRHEYTQREYAQRTPAEEAFPGATTSVTQTTSRVLSGGAAPRVSQQAVPERRGVSALLTSASSSRPTLSADGKEHICECGMRFQHRGHYNAHKRAVHEKIRPHKCSYKNCDSAFAKRSDLLRHQLSLHADEVRFPCSQCSVSFPDRAQLALHYTVLHDQDRPYKCKHCVKSYSTRSGLRKHNINKHAEENKSANNKRCTPTTTVHDADSSIARSALAENDNEYNAAYPQPLVAQTNVEHVNQRASAPVPGTSPAIP